MSADEYFPLNIPYITVSNWKEFSEEDYPDPGFMGYLYATANFIQQMNQILETASTFEEMKNQVEQLRNERSAFKDYAEMNLP